MKRQPGRVAALNSIMSLVLRSPFYPRGVILDVAPFRPSEGFKIQILHIRDNRGGQIITSVQILEHPSAARGCSRFARPGFSPVSPDTPWWKWGGSWGNLVWFVKPVLCRLLHMPANTRGANSKPLQVLPLEPEWRNGNLEAVCSSGLASSQRALCSPSLRSHPHRLSI